MFWSSMIAQAGPQALRMFALLKTLKMSVGLRTAHLSVTDGSVKAFRSMSNPDGEQGFVEVRCPLRSSDSLCLSIGHLPRSDHLVQLSNDAVLLHGSTCSSSSLCLIL